MGYKEAYKVGEHKYQKRPHGPGGMGRGGEKSKDLIGTWRKLLDYGKAYHKAIVLAVICAIGGTILTLVGPDKLSEITDIITAGIMTGIDLPKVTQIGLTLAGLYIISYGLSAFQGWTMATVTQKVTKRLRSDIVEKIDRLPMTYFAQTSTGDVLSRVTNDIDMIGQSMNMSVGALVSAITLLVGSFIMMLWTNLWLTVTAVSATLIGIILIVIMMKRSQKYFKRQQAHLGQLNGHIEEIYAGHTIVKAYNGEAKAQQTFDEMNEQLRDSGFKSQCLAGMMMPLMTFIGNLGYVAVCIVGAALAMSGRITFGVIVAFILYIRYFTQPLAQIAQAMQNMQSAAAAGERVFEFLQEEEMKKEDIAHRVLDTCQGKVTFEHVRFGYEGTGKVLIKDFSAVAQPGQKIAIVGPTGAGKTTIINLLMRFYDIQGGQIYIDDHPTQTMSREEVHSQFCMVLQDTWIFEGSVRDNLIYCSENQSEEKMKAACRAVGIDHFIQTLPEGYDTILNDHVNLSQGQRQQLTIARAMIADKPMLILDEATSSVDTRTEVHIQRAMDELMKGRTSFVIAHRLSTIKNADMILVMKEGDIIEKGTHEELLAAKGFYTDLYNSQFETDEEIETA